MLYPFEKKLTLCQSATLVGRIVSWACWISPSAESELTLNGPTSTFLFGLAMLGRKPMTLSSLAGFANIFPLRRRLCEKLVHRRRPSSSARGFRGSSVPWSSLPDQFMVPAIRDSKAYFCLLPWSNWFCRLLCHLRLCFRTCLRQSMFTRC